MATVSDASYVRVVKDTLATHWHRQPLSMSDDDFTAAITLLANIAVEAVHTNSSIKTSENGISAIARTSLETASLSAADKIRAFVKNQLYGFSRACQRGFPFSRLEQHLTEAALKHALKDYSSILSHFMMLEGHWMSESELDERFKDLFQCLPVREIAEACSTLKRTYLRGKDNKAGYYLLWLIKQATGAVYEIPEPGSFNHATVANVLSEFFAGSRSLRNTANFIEILHVRDCRLDNFLYQDFLDQKFLFLRFMIEQLVDMPMDTWPSKAGIIIDLLETVESESKLRIAKALSLSQDSTTSGVGNHVLAALQASSLREAVPHLHALKKLLPGLNDSHVHLIFDHPSVAFCRDRSMYPQDPEFVRRLNFNATKEVFVHGSLMMGVYYTQSTICRSKGILPHLLAYDMYTEQIVWGLPLTPLSLDNPPKMRSTDYSLKRVGEWISLQSKEEKQLRLIRPETGEVDDTLELPEVDTYTCVHINPEGFAYQLVHKGGNRVLVGGMIRDKQWDISFKANSPNGFFCSFSTHCGFALEDYRWILFGPQGDQITLENCMTAQAHGDKIYTVEKDPVNANKCLLNIRSLKLNHDVVSDVENSIPLNARNVSFGKICHNGQIVLFSDTSPLFVDLQTQEVTYSAYKLPCALKYPMHIVNPDSGELWVVNAISGEIWKVSSSNMTLMGSMQIGRGTTLVHVDTSDRLYFVDLPV